MMDDFRDSCVCIVLFRSISLWFMDQFSQPTVLCALIPNTERDATSAYPELSWASISIQNTWSQLDLAVPI